MKITEDKELLDKLHEYIHTPLGKKAYIIEIIECNQQHSMLVTEVHNSTLHEEPFSNTWYFKLYTRKKVWEMLTEEADIYKSKTGKMFFTLEEIKRDGIKNVLTLTIYFKPIQYLFLDWDNRYIYVKKEVAEIAYMSLNAGLHRKADVRTGETRTPEHLHKNEKQRSGRGNC